MAIINIKEGVSGKKSVSNKEGAGDKVIILLISLSLSFLRLIQCIFNRCRAKAMVLLPLLFNTLYNCFAGKQRLHS
jgi:hypothetical protein